jgi:D-cysteine desulfhydrase
MAVREPERVLLANLPTPLVRLTRLERKLGDAQIWLKRDDLTGLELSGNKVRKLEYVLADALRGGFDTIVTEGTPQSNLCRAVAVACARLGLRAHLLLRPRPTDQPQGNQLLDTLSGATSEAFERDRFEREREAIVTATLDRLRSEGRRPRFTPTGASEPLGCWGYIRAAAELASQLLAAGVQSCDVVVALSSGGTYAGLLLGTLLHRLDHWRLWAVPVSDDVGHHTREVRRLCQATIERFGLPIQFDDGDLRFLDGYVGDGYAVPYPEAIEAIRALARMEGVVLDPVYTAKAFWAVLDGVRARRFGHERPVVFVHTGGIFSNFAWPETLLSTGEAEPG